MREMSRISRFLEELPEEVQDKPATGGRTEIIQKDDSHIQYGEKRIFVKQYTSTNSEEQIKRMMGKNNLDLSQGAGEEFHVGDSVVHRKFGLGVVEEVIPMNADCQVTVNFVKAGQRKLMAGLAGLKKAPQ